MIQDHPRRAEALHPMDCSCCEPRADRFDSAAASLRVLIGLGWGALIGFVLQALTGVPVV